MSRRHLMAIILLLPLLLSSPTLADLASPVEAQPYGGTLKVALPSEPNTFNWFSAGSTWSINVLIPVYNRLFRWKNGTLMPELVKDWSVSDDGLTYTFTIHNNVTFQDGKQLTAEDVVFTINVEAQNDWPYYHGYFAKVDRAEVVDQFTFKIYMKEVDAGFLANALAVMNVLPKHIWEPLLNEKGEELAVYNPKLPDEVIGSGPFKLVEYVPGQYVKYTAYENYWQGRPYIDELIVTFITEATTAILAVKKGDIDLYEGWITPEVVPSLITTEGVGIHLYQSATFYHWGFNNLRWPFNITDFRRAMAYCVDKNEIVNTLLAGYGMPGSWGVVPPFGIHAYWYNPNVEGKYSFNLTKAGEILDSLGFVDVDGDGWREAPDGSDFSFEIYPPNYDIIRVRAAQMISDWLSKIPNGGIKAEVRVLEWKSVWPLIRDGKVDSYLLGSGPGADPTWLYRRFHSRPGGTGNWARYSNPEVDQLTEQIGKVLDKEQRREIAWRIQEILADEVPIIVLYYRKFPQPYRADKFDGWFKAVDDGLYNFWTFRYVHLKVETTQPTEPTQPTQPTEPTQPTPPPEEPEMGTNLQFMAALVVIVILIVIIVVLLVKKR